MRIAADSAAAVAVIATTPSIATTSATRIGDPSGPRRSADLRGRGGPMSRSGDSSSDPTNGGGDPAGIGAGAVGSGAGGACTGEADAAWAGGAAGGSATGGGPAGGAAAGAGAGAGGGSGGGAATGPGPCGAGAGGATAGDGTGSGACEGAADLGEGSGAALEGGTALDVVGLDVCGLGGGGLSGGGASAGELGAGELGADRGAGGPGAGVLAWAHNGSPRWLRPRTVTVHVSPGPATAAHETLLPCPGSSAATMNRQPALISITSSTAVSVPVLVTRASCRTGSPARGCAGTTLVLAAIDAVATAAAAHAGIPQRTTTRVIMMSASVPLPGITSPSRRPRRGRS